MGMGYLAGLHVRLGAKFGDLRAKDSSLFRKRLIARVLKIISPLFKAVNYSQQFLIMGIIPDFRPLKFSTIECY